MIDDKRGFFAKIFHRPLWEELGLCTEFEEEYVTRSHAGTLRGMHFQVPPMQHHKVVLCLRGRAWDVAVDLRKDSPTYGEHVSVNLTDTMANALYLPAGPGAWLLRDRRGSAAVLQAFQRVLARA